MPTINPIRFPISINKLIDLGKLFYNWNNREIHNQIDQYKTKGPKQYFTNKGKQTVQLVGENLPYFVPGSQAYMGLKAVDDFQKGDNLSGAINTAFAAMPLAGVLVKKLPGYMLRPLMEGSPLEKQLSKTGTININNIRALINKGSDVEKSIVDKVLTEKFAGQTAVDYNEFRKAILDELITFQRVPLTNYADYGAERLNLTRPLKENELPAPPTTIDINNPGPVQYGEPIRDDVKFSTFTFESPRLPIGHNRHYNSTTLGHSRTYTTPEEPEILHVMESQSDWALQYPSKEKIIKAIEKTYPKAISSYEANIRKWQEMLDKGVNDYGEPLYDWTEKEVTSYRDEAANLLKEYQDKLAIAKNPQTRYLVDNYELRQLQENLKYAAEHNQTKMRYPTPETAAKIEGYSKTHYTPEYELALEELRRLSVPEGELAPIPDEISLFNDRPIYYTPEKKALLLRDAENKVADLELAQKDRTYSPEHQTILNKYQRFPKLYQKLYPKSQVRTITDGKGNTWFEVDVPENYLELEWRWKKGGKLVKKKR